MSLPETYPAEGCNYLKLAVYTLDDGISRIEQRKNWDTGQIFYIRNGGLDTDIDVWITEAQYQAMCYTGQSLF